MNAYACLFYGVALAEPESDQAKFYRELLASRDALLSEQDKLLYNAPEWVASKCSIMTDAQLYSLHVSAEAEAVGVDSDVMVLINDFIFEALAPETSTVNQRRLV